MHQDLILKPGKEKAIIHRHPWIFSGAVKNLPQSREGEIIAVRNSKLELLGYGFYSIKSQIVCRIFEFTNIETDFSPSYWKNKIFAAYNCRKSLAFFGSNNAYRLLHAEGDFMPGIIADVYNDTVVIQFLIDGTLYLQQTIVAAFLEIGFRYVYLKSLDESKKGSKWLTAPGEIEIEMLENGIKMGVNIEEGQKTGTFLDQRENRKLLGTFSAGKTVLNAFSYTGGFSLQALQNKAKLVHSVDVSKRAIELANQNVLLNFGENAPHLGIVADCFEYLRNPKESYDLIILDPPAFAKNMAAVEKAARGYKDLNLQAFQKVLPGGIIFTFSCSQKISTDLFRKIVFSAASDARKNVRILHQLSQPADHPINIFHPEGEYLKGLVLFVE